MDKKMKCSMCSKTMLTIGPRSFFCCRITIRYESGKPFINANVDFWRAQFETDDNKFVELKADRQSKELEIFDMTKGSPTYRTKRKIDKFVIPEKFSMESLNKCYNKVLKLGNFE